MNETIKKEFPIVLIGIFISLLIFSIDLFLPSGVAGGVPYVVLVLFGFWTSWRHYFLFAAGLGTFLTLLGYFMSPAGGTLWMVILNRLLALLAIWTTAILCFLQRRAKEEIQDLNRKLADRVAEKTEEFRESRNLLAKAQEIAHLGNWEWDVSKKEQTWSEETYRIFGFPTFQFKPSDETFFELVHPEDRTFVQESIQNALFHDIPYRIDFRIVCEDGTEKYVHSEGEVHFDEDRQPSKILGTIQDITERKQIEECLLEAHNFVSAILNTVDALIVVLDPEGKIVRFNQACKKKTGYTFQEVQGKHVWDLFLIPGEVELVKSVFMDLMEKKTPNSFENRWRTKEGNLRWISWSNSCLLSPTGEVEFIIGSGIDITERKIAEDALKKSEEQFRLVTDALPVLISYVDSEQRYQFNNKVYEEWHGRPRSEIKGKHVKEVLGEDAYKKVEKHINEALSGKEVNYEVCFTLGDGKYRCMNVTYFPHFGEDQKVKGYIVLVDDITHRREMEQQREDLLKTLQQANTDLKDFAYIVSHDLKAPLRTISSLSKILNLKIRDNLDPKEIEILDLLQDRAKRMNNLLEGLLQYSGIDRIQAIQEELEVESVIQEVIDMLSPPDTIRIYLEGEFPLVVYDPTQLKQIFQNLIGNAIVHLGKPLGEIIISCKTRENNWEFCVKDSGIGIDENHFERIFKIFQTLRPKDEVNTTGVGLAVVKKIVEKNGGSIWVESEKRRGSSFYFTIAKGKNKI